MVVIDDLGWNNVPWHNPELQETMPRSLELVREGVELNRHYAFLFCSPSRSSLISGRLPFHVNQVNVGENHVKGGIAEGMTSIAAKLKGAGFATHATGKWHCGSATKAKTPRGQGFDTHLGYFTGSEDHWTQHICSDPTCNTANNSLVDLWRNDRPAYGENGTAYGDEMYTKFVIEAIQQHTAEQPMFFYVALQNNHQPLEAPRAYVDRFPEEWTFDRRMYAAMGAYWDEALGNITDALKAASMWDDTLLVLTADNGGPVYATLKPSFNHCGGANNYPLRGGKMNNFEGGVRAAAFVAGGFLPEEARGTKQNGIIHIADWYATFATLAGIDPRDPDAVAQGLPDTDGLDMWPMITGQNSTSPRFEVPLSINSTVSEGGNGLPTWLLPKGALQPVSALIWGDYKLIGGSYMSVFDQELEWPTEQTCCEFTCWYKQVQNCGTAEQPTCLFNIIDDISEAKNLASAEPDRVLAMTRRLRELEREIFAPQLDDVKNDTAKAIWETYYGGFIGPWADLDISTLV